MRPDTTHNGQLDPIEAAEQLAAMWTLADDGIRGARLHGHGPDMLAEIDVHDGARVVTITFEPFTAMIRPQTVVGTLASMVGVSPALKQEQCARAIVLVRALAEHHESASLQDDARAWGVEYLQAAEILDFDVLSQRERWSAFKHLETVNPWDRARDRGVPLAAGSVVLRHTDGSVLVRTGWFRAFVRGEHDPGISPARLATRMEAVGWARRGGAGRIKATNPGVPNETLAWSFYDVPADWVQVTR